MLSDADFVDPPQTCDIVMKGGITSGIVYPSAILRIAQRFRFKNIGGTSAGAIAAAVAAAAEFRRAGGSGDGFLKVRTQIMDWLAQGSHLQSLFVPVMAAGPLFYPLVGLLNVKSKLQQFQGSGAQWTKRAASLIIVLLAILAYAQILFQFRIPGVGTVPQVVFALAVGLIVAALLWILYVLPLSNFGMCTGGVQGRWPGSAEPLTFWLSRQIDDIAGMESNRPLTFGDLWCGRIRRDDELGESAPTERCINLEMVTTSLTMGRPFSLPFTTNIFYFRPSELRRFFPGYVVDWMTQLARGPDPGDEDSTARHDFLAEQGFVPMPSAADLPIVVAARLSLSFPMLLSAIRLYAVDFQLPANEGCKRTPKIDAVWFSDGGVSSNFPISFFDSPIPRWPTLGITLEEFPPGVDQEDPVNGAYVPTSNQSEIGSIWTRFSQDQTPSNTPGFYGAIINSMQNWQDTMQSEAPGFRDRIAHVRLGPQEGGLNLTMPTSTINTLLARGELAGELLVEHFEVPIPIPPLTQMTWDNHRWIRLRTTLDVVERYAATFSQAWNDVSQNPSYGNLIRAGGVNQHYRLTPVQQQSALSVASSINALTVPTSPAGASLSTDAPHPVSDLHAKPRF